jgi:integrase
MSNDHHIKTIVELRAEVERLRALRSNALPGYLTDSKIAKLTKHWTRDCDNLYIQISRLGSRRRSWVFRYQNRIKRKMHNIGLGPYPTISIDQARELALRYRQMLLEGKDPKTERDKTKLDMLIARRLVKTVREVAMEWFENKIAKKAPGYRDKIFNQLNKYVYSTIGDLPIQKVTTDIILETDLSDRQKGVGLLELWKRVNPTAHDIQMYLERIFDFAIRRKYFKGENPARWKGLLDDILPARSDVYHKGNRIELPHKDVGRFMQALRAHEDRSDRKTGHPTVALLLELAVLTGCRISEVRLAQWKEFDLTTMTWTVPWQHLKMGRKHQRDLPRPISKPMIPVLEEMQKRRLDQSDDALVFPGPRSNKPITTSTISVFVASTLKWEIKIHAHGFRGTLRNWMRTKTNFKDVFWKIQVDHKVGIDASDDAYGRDKFLEDRRPLMELWGEYCSKPAPEPMPGKVLEMHKKRRTA